jgi:hypothetical protein
MGCMIIDIPEVQAFKQSARFYKDNGRDMVELSFIGSKDTLINKVTPEHMAKYRQEWTAYCDGLPPGKRPGTALTELMDETRGTALFNQNVHNLEELSALSDGQCQALGHGTLTLRENAKKLLMQRAFESKRVASERIAEKSADIGPVPADKYAGQTEVAALSAKVDSLADSVAALVQMMTPKKPGRPKKPVEE